MKRKLVGGTLMALVILSSLALATAKDQQAAVKDNTLENGGHSKIWVKVDGSPAQEIPAKIKQEATAEPEAAATPEAEAAPVQQPHQDTQKADADELQKKLAKAESTIQELQEKLDAAEQNVSAVEAVQKKLTQADSTIQELKEKIQKSERTIQELNKQRDAVQALTEQPLTVTECDALRAQVKGLEIIAQEQMKTIEQNIEEKNYWQINKNLLLSKIKELQNNIKKLE